MGLHRNIGHMLVTQSKDDKGSIDISTNDNHYSIKVTIQTKRHYKGDVIPPSSYVQ